MDSLSLNITVSHRVNLHVDNGALNPSKFSDYRERSVGTSSIGAGAGAIDRLYLATHTLAPSGSVTINLGAVPTEPAEAAGGVFAKLVDMHIEMVDNLDGSTNGSGIRFGDAAGTNMAQLWFGSVSTTFTVGSADTDSYWSTHDDAGVAVGGNSIKFTNLDSTDTVTFNLLLTGRSS